MADDLSPAPPLPAARSAILTGPVRSTIFLLALPVLLEQLLSYCVEMTDLWLSGRISKEGSRELRWALVQAAWTAVRCDESVKKIWLKIRQRTDGKRAIIAIARS